MFDALITGTGVHSPAERITNDELVVAFNDYVARYNAANADAIAAGTRTALQPSSAEFIEKASGIRQRFVADKDGVLDPARMFPRIAARADDALSLQAEYAVAAARLALTQAGRDGSEVDAVLCACSAHQRMYPAMAVEIQHALGAGGHAFDMNVACSSATFALEYATNAVRAGSARCVLIVNPELTSPHLEWRDRDCHFIFGDVATAILVERDTGQTQGWQVLGTKLATQFSNNIRNNFGFLNRSEDGDPAARDKLFRQEGRKVFKEVVPIAAAHIEGHLASLDLQAASVRRFWLHQANIGMNQLIGKRLLGRDATMDESPVILDRYANTASAGSIIAFHEHRGDLASGDVGVICSFGAGYSVGSAVLRKR
ncbi:MAG: beta-ketoacyl-ACP synthase III [Moraxellaceae bacterium]|nr:beta-ketoacyl-ACP synthase III [Moraxellaceae bacterium]